MAQLNTIIDCLTTLLEPHRYVDSACNGVQVDADNHTIRTVAGAVDCGESIISRAIELRSDLLIVHHGMYWGSSPHIATGTHGAKLRALIKGGCTLYGAHLPLDGNLEVGNASEILRFLGVQNAFPFGSEGPVTLGACGTLDSPTSLNQIAKRLSSIEGYGPEVLLPFGRTEITSIAVCTGAGGFTIEEAKHREIDLLISGEPKHAVYHQAKELKQSALFIGHYASETFGVKAVLRVLERTFGVSTVWISEPTGI